MALDVYKDWLGIPDGPRPPGHYELLRLVEFEADDEKVRAHYRKLNAHVRKYASGQYSVQSQELLNELAKAMLCLTDPVRKREYDESLGRVFEEDKDAFGRKPLESVLVQLGHITREQSKEALKFAEGRGLSLRDAVVQMKLIDPPTAAEALARHLALPFVDLNDLLPDETVLDRVPRNVVKQFSILPLFVDEGMVLVACADEPGHEIEEELRLRFGMPMRAVIATPLSINQGIAKYYASGMRDESVAEAALAAQAAAGKGKTKDAKGAGAKSKSAMPAKIRAPKVPFAQLSPDEQQQKKMIGYILMCWGTLAGVALDVFVLRGYLANPRPGGFHWPFPFSLGYLATFFSAPISIWWVLKVYWK